MLKNGTFPDILQKGKLIILLEAIILRSNPIEIPKKCKIKAPSQIFYTDEFAGFFTFLT